LQRRNQALAAIQQAIDHHRNDPIGYVDRGWMLLGLGREDEAEAMFRWAWRIHPPPASAAYFLGQLAERQGDKAEAARWYRQGLALPTDWIRDHFSHLEAGYGRLGLPPLPLVTRPLLTPADQAQRRLETALERVSSSS
jgi:tetratricopeptide (TPR) repeat protein